MMRDYCLPMGLIFLFLIALLALLRETVMELIGLDPVDEGDDDEGEAR